MIVKNITSDSVVMHTPAKVNLFLEVLNKREDGFHNINSLFQAVSLFDEIEYKKSEKSTIEINFGKKIDLPSDKNNLIAKVYNLLKKDFPQIGGLEVNLTKNIPIAAGLGGGSSDAAATLKACNILFDLGLTDKRLSDYGIKIGSDIPFFFGSGQALVSGRGEIIEKSDYPTDYFLVLVNPNIPISTAEAYAQLKRDLTKPKNPFNLGECRTVDNFFKTLLETGNDFEEVHLKSFDFIRKIKEGLQQTGAVLSRMSGSGPTMFGLYKSEPGLEDLKSFNWGNWQIYAVMPVTL